MLTIHLVAMLHVVELMNLPLKYVVMTSMKTIRIGEHLGEGLLVVILSMEQTMKVGQK